MSSQRTPWGILALVQVYLALLMLLGPSPVAAFTEWFHPAEQSVHFVWPAFAVALSVPALRLANAAFLSWRKDPAIGSIPARPHADNLWVTYVAEVARSAWFSSSYVLSATALPTKEWAERVLAAPPGEIVPELAGRAEERTFRAGIARRLAATVHVVFTLREFLAELTERYALLQEAIDSILPGASTRYTEAAALTAAIRDQVITTSGRVFHAGNLIDGILAVPLPSWIPAFAPPKELTPTAASQAVVSWVESFADSAIAKSITSLLLALPEGTKPASSAPAHAVLDVATSWIRTANEDLATWASSLLVPRDQIAALLAALPDALDTLAAALPSLPQEASFVRAIELAANRIRELVEELATATAAAARSATLADERMAQIQLLEQELVAIHARGGGFAPAAPTITFSQKFGGDITKTSDWLMGARMFVSARGATFLSGADAVMYFVNLLEGTAASWASSYGEAFTTTFAPVGRTPVDAATAILDAIRDHFVDINATTTAAIALRRLRQTGTFSQFIVEFESLCHRAGWNAQRNGLEMAAELRASLRSPLREAINADLAAADAEAEVRRTVNDLTYAVLRLRALRRDASMPLAQTPARSVARTNVTPLVAPAPGPSPAPAPSGSGPARIPDIPRHLCGITCSYDEPSPVVPAGLRGRIYFGRGTLRDGTVAPPNHVAGWEARHGRCQEAGVCESCRRPCAAHQGQQTFRAIGPFRAATRAATTEAGLHGDD